MEFRRITGLPPYVFTIIDGLKIEARRAGETSSTWASATPTCPSPEVAVEKLAEAAHNPATTATRPVRASRSCARPSPTSTCAASA
jgi:hypothetical protein